MSTRFTEKELRSIARNPRKPDREREMAAEILESRGLIPEDTIEERRGGV